MSFDVKSLFTNILVDFTIKLTLNQLFPDKQSKIDGLSKKQFETLLKWTCKKTTLQFNRNYFHQLDGLAMDSPLAPAMADICMNWLTNEVLEKNKIHLLSCATLVIYVWHSTTQMTWNLYIKNSAPFIQI